MSLLDHIDTPEQLRQLKVEQLPELCEDIRKYLISSLSRNPGHFGSSMGAVDIIVALHYVFNTPRDRIVWDVGHQAYAHKILTGRREAFATQRTKGGISGFPNPAESNYDTFVCGHAGNSISAALGMAISDLNTPGEEDRKTIAVIGDASISGGLAFEGLNNASNNPNNLLIILNDNDMSIGKNVGALHSSLLELTTSAGYNRMRYRIYRLFKKLGLINDRRKGLLLRFSNSLKSLISARQNIFDGLNIRYFGPFDGNDVTRIVKVLNDIKDMKGPRILHLSTVKGKGYAPAEQCPSEWHAPGNFDPETGKKIKSPTVSAPLWQEVFGEKLVELADRNDKVVGITAAMLSGTSVDKMMAKYPARTFDVGISEGHAVTFAGGLAAAGKKPYVAIYSSFLQRALDNIIHDVAIQGLPVTFCIDRAGVVGEDGVTHHGLFDLAYLRMIPNLYVASPLDRQTFEKLLDFSSDFTHPLAIRYPRGKAFDSDGKLPDAEITPGRSRRIVENHGAEIAILTIGQVGKNAMDAAEKLKKEGKPVDVYDMIWLKPIDEKLLESISGHYKTVITVEDATINGGFGSAVAEWYAGRGTAIKVVSLGAPDRWIGHATVSELQNECGYDAEGIAEAVRKIIIPANGKDIL